MHVLEVFDRLFEPFGRAFLFFTLTMAWLKSEAKSKRVACSICSIISVTL
jgi:hypothetical protein